MALGDAERRPYPAVLAWIRSILGHALMIFGSLIVSCSHMFFYHIMRFTIKPISPSLFYYIEGKIFQGLVYHSSGWLWILGFRVKEWGEDVSDAVNNDQSIVVANHQTALDTLILAQCFSGRTSLFEQEIIILWDLIQYCHFGYCMKLHDYFFVAEGRKIRTEQFERMVSHFAKSFRRRGKKTILFFPEGGFLINRKESSNKYAKKFNYPILQNVTLPRIGAMQAIVDTLSPAAMERKAQSMDLSEADKGLDWLIDITIAFPKADPIALKDIVWGDRVDRNINVHFRKFPAKDIPMEPGPLRKWMYDRWQEKEQLLEHFYKTGMFPPTATVQPATLKTNGLANDPNGSTPGTSRPGSLVQGGTYSRSLVNFILVLFFYSLLLVLDIFILWNLLSFVFNIASQLIWIAGIPDYWSAWSSKLLPLWI